MSKHNLNDLFRIQEQLSALDLSTVSDSVVTDILKDLWKDAAPLGIGLDHRRIWFRARRCENRTPFNNLHELIYNKNGCSQYGRAQVAGSKVLYAGWNQNVALDEIERSDGDMVQITALRPRMGPEVPCFAVGEVVGFRNSNRSQLGSTALERHLQTLGADFPLVAYRDAVIAHHFRQRVEHNYQYKITAAFAELFHGAGGFIFPSVQTPYAYNLAISDKVFDTSFEVIATKVLIVQSAPGYGIYEVKEHSRCHEFLPDGTIMWGSTVNPNLGMQGAAYQPGWRKA